MINSHNELARMVLQAVANDYEDFEMIVSEIVGWTSKDNVALDVSQIQDALMKSIADKDVKAYEPSETSNHLIVTQADPQKIRTLWFYITEQGKKRLQGLDEEDEFGVSGAPHP